MKGIEQQAVYIQALTFLHVQCIHSVISICKSYNTIRYFMQYMLRCFITTGTFKWFAQICSYSLGRKKPHIVLTIIALEFYFQR
jgi:hypothetical protein